MTVTIDAIHRAAERLRGVAHRTPVLTSRTLDDAAGAQRVPQVREPAARRRVQVPRRLQHDRVAARRRSARAASLAYSSGNHAQAVALAARLLGVPATIVMPADAPAAEDRRDARLRRRGRALRPLHGGPRGDRRAARAPSAG